MRTQPVTDRLDSGDDRTEVSSASLRLGGAAGVLAFLAYLPGVDRPFFYDEAQTVGFFIVDGSPFDALRRQRLFNNHPFLSFLDNILVQITGRSDEWILRILPLVFAAMAIGVLVWAVHAVWGTVPAIVAGTIVATNPLFVHYGRAVRGYSLLVLAATASTILLIRALSSSSNRSRLAYVVVAVIGLLTHLCMVAVLLIHALEVVRRRSLDRRWLWSFLGIAALAGLFYAPMISALRASTERFVAVDGESTAAEDAAFFPELAFELLGGSLISAYILGVLSLAGILLLRRSTLTTTAVLTGSVIVAAAWAAAPENTGPRFFIWLLPAVAVTGAAAARRHPLLVGTAVLVGAAGSIATFASGYSTAHSTYPDIAQIVDAAAATGMTACVTDLSVPPLLAYTQSFEAVVEPLSIDHCDLVAIAAPDLDDEYLETARSHFFEERRVGHGLVFTRPSGAGEP